ncbi:SDR family oxidoreductase [Chryseobacterium sp. RG1]|uniref:SDR family oxidoreductase n=1 Tax=Chryseobacterium tagetis TaxID=2801334 RepID=A0ABS8A1N2_9FLAO|nr:SDR family oxidoreductase [Chryseobacterium tagetis]MCA6067705.1 SDR family oxidoreductase [Chryseobacterium tagetis]
MEIKNVKAIITGGTSGIGYEAAKVLKEFGAEVVICGTNEFRVNQTTKELGVYGIKADVTIEEEVLALFDYAKERMGTVNVLINNAGIGKFISLVETTAEDFQKVWEVNVRGFFLAGREAAKHFVENQYGNIINIGSTASLRGYANGSSYVASKFAVSGLTECWRAELRPYNVRVMQINPSEVITDFLVKEGIEIKNEANKLKPKEIAHLIVNMLSMSDTGFIPDASVWATNPW